MKNQKLNTNKMKNGRGKKNNYTLSASTTHQFQDTWLFRDEGEAQFREAGKPQKYTY